MSEWKQYEGFLQEFEDDPSLTYKSPYPVGHWLKLQMERNKQEPVRTALKEMHEWEKDHIADPLSYCTTQPDIEIRYNV